MDVQTIPPIREMTPSQRVELMEALWAEMSRNPAEVPVPDWHRRELEKRAAALAKGEDEYIDWEIAKEQIRLETSENNR